MILPGAPWQSLVFPGTPWYFLVLPGAPWFSLVVLPGNSLHSIVLSCIP